MREPRIPRFVIGEGQWADEIRAFTALLHPEYWHGFRPLSEEEIAALEQSLQRSLPRDFRQFLLTFGAGQFPGELGGGIWPPETVYENCHGLFTFLLGSFGWAPEEDQRRFYVSRGAFNPAPELFTDEVLETELGSLFDLLMIGEDGCGCYHVIYVGQEPGDVAYCLATDTPSFEDCASSFSEGLRLIMLNHWQMKTGFNES